MISQITDKQYDVIIAGAGPAGCSAAFFLAKQGFEVLLADKAVFPRDKVCGDGIGPNALDVLDRMDIVGAIEAEKPWKATHVAVQSPQGSVLKGKIPKKDNLRDFYYIFPRFDFDAVLFNHLKYVTNVKTLENFQITDLLYNEKRICGVTGKYNNKSERINGKYIIGADGVNSIIARKLNLLNNNKHHKCFSVRAYFDNVSGLDTSLEIYFDKSVLPGYGWIFPVSENKANIGVGIDMFELSRSSKNIRQLFEAFIEKFAQDKLEKAVMLKDSFKGCQLNMRSFAGPRYKDNVFLIGDAGSMINPVTGEGIDYALRSGEHAALALGQALSENKKTGKVYQDMCMPGINWLSFIFIKRIFFFIMKTFLFNFIEYLSIKNPDRVRALAKSIIYRKK